MQPKIKEQELLDLKRGSPQTSALDLMAYRKETGRCSYRAWRPEMAHVVNSCDQFNWPKTAVNRNQTRRNERQATLERYDRKIPLYDQPG